MATNDNTYAGNTLDIYLNDTWYNTLTADAKAAIIDKNITQYQYSSNNSAYNENTHASYADYSTKSVKNEIGNRHIYALDIEDIEEYFNGEFGKGDIWILFWDTQTQPTASNYPLFRSAYAINSCGVWYFRTHSGYFLNESASDTYAARPAFTIDLSKIDFTINT